MRIRVNEPTFTLCTVDVPASVLFLSLIHLFFIDSTLIIPEIAMNP
jgi:hypothetical protein